MKIFYAVVFSGIILIGLWNLMIAVLGCFPKFRATVVADLADTSTVRNLRARGGRIIPRITQYQYIYTVKGKLYRYSDENYRSKRHLLPKATLVYVKGFPRHAYRNKFTGLKEWILGILLLLLGAMLLYTAIVTPQ